MKNIATRYEVAASGPDGASYLVGYTARRSRSGLLEVARQKGPELLERFKVTDAPATWFKERNRWSLHFGGGLVVRFTGRTRHEAVSSPLKDLKS